MAAAKSFKEIEDALKKAIETVTAVPSFRSIAKLAAEIIVRRTRLGRGVKKAGGPSAPLKKLTSKYIEKRKRDQEEGTLSANTTPGRSNLTRTSQMLNSIKGEAVSRGQIVIAATGSRKDETATNEDVAGFVSKDRPFMVLSDAEVRQITQEIEKKLSEEIERALRKFK